MPSFEYDIGERERSGSRFISHVHSEIQKAVASEKAARKLTQQKIADTLGVNRSRVNRQVLGLENMTIRSVAELLWAIGWEPIFEARKVTSEIGQNEPNGTQVRATTISADDFIKAEFSYSSDALSSPTASSV